MKNQKSPPEEWEKDEEFSRKLEEVLDEQFPKGECQERGQALIINSYANIFHAQILNAKLSQAREQGRREGREELLKELNITKDFKLAEWRRAYEKGWREAVEEMKKMFQKDVSER